MALVEFSEQLKRAESVLDLARRLGELCLADNAELLKMERDPHTSRELEAIERLAGRASHAVWASVVDDPDSLERRLGARLAEVLRRTRTRQPLDFLGVLRGLCSCALVELFATTTGQVELARGMPLPFATRPLPEALVGELTTTQDTLNDSGLLSPLPFDLYTHVAKEELRVVLDFSHAERLDALTWEEEKALPRIATLHPEGGGSFEIKEIAPGRFFGVRPKNWDPGAVLALLAQAKAVGARVAVLPELSLPHPAALEEELAANHEEYPPLIVAGSAHHKSGGTGNSDEIRANESHFYLDGQRVAATRKHHRFKTKQLGDQRFEQLAWEDLTAEPKTITVLSGRRTRVGVAICADLLEKGIPRLLVDAGANLLLAPTMTSKIGSFNPPLAEVAGWRQGVAAIANTRWRDDGEPFLCMCAVPRPKPEQQSRAFAGDGGNPAPQLAILDPNKPLPEAVSWPGRGGAERGRVE